MLETRLIFVEGLPGSGKSTTARHIASRVQQAGRTAELIAETQLDHPLNVGGALHPAGRGTGEELFRRYGVETYLAESVARWKTFVTTALSAGVLSVLDSYPYQNAARVLLQLDCPVATLREYAQQIEVIARPLAPVLVYLETSPGADALTEVWDQRGTEWREYVIAVATACPYAVHRELSGMDGALTFLGAYDALVRQLLADSTLPRLGLERCRQDWQACYQRLAAFLAL